VIGKLIMNSVSGHPEDRSTFKRQSSARGQEIFNPFRRLVAAMGQQAVIAHADSEAARNPPEHERRKKGFPGEKEKSRDGADMKCRHETCGYPINLIVVP